MNLIYSLLLGFLQGATEFLPVSSSGHLVLAEESIGLTGTGLAFDVALHLGTLAAVLIYFRHDFLGMARALLPGRAGSGAAAQQRLFWYIVIGTVPAVVFAVLFGDFVESRLRSPLSVAVMLAAGGLLLLAAERLGKHARQMETLTLTDVLLIGFCQALALMPGVSRSGITMTACLLLGFDRPGAVRFSFLLSAPVILGAGVYNLPGIVQHGLNSGQLPFYLSGFFAAAVSGYAVIAFLLKFVRTRSLAPFAYYRFILAGAVLLAVAV